MLLRLVVLCVFLPTVALAQQSTRPGGCEGKNCPDGQIMDPATNACVPVSA